MVSSFDSLKNCIPLAQGTERHLWVTDKQGNIQWINRKNYSRLKQNGRLQVAFGSFKNLVNTLPKIDGLGAEKIQLLSNLKKQITNKYLNFHKAHSTPLFGYLYRLLFARSLDNNYKAALLSIDTYLKNHISKLSVDEFKTFISFFKPEEAVSYLSILGKEQLNKFAPLLSDEFLIKLESSQIEKLQLDKFTNKQICLIKDKLTIQQLNKLNLFNWSYDDVINLYTSKNVAKADCIKTINPAAWSFVDLKLFLMRGLHTYSKNIHTIYWPSTLKNQLKNDGVFCNWASIYVKNPDLLDLPPVLLAMITNFNPNAIHQLAAVSRKSYEHTHRQEWVNEYFRHLKDAIGEDNLNYLKEKFPEIKFLTKKCIEKLTQEISKELRKEVPKGIMSADELANCINLIEDRNLAFSLNRIFGKKSQGKIESEALLKKAKEIHEDEKSPEMRFKLIAQLIREEFTKLGPEALGKVKWLDLSCCDLTSIPKEIFLLKNLMHLTLTNNQLTSIPPQIRNLTKLESLNLNKNKIINLRQEMVELISLRELDISNNSFPGIPSSEEIETLPNIQSLSFTYPPRTIGSIIKTKNFTFKSRFNLLKDCLKEINRELAKHKSTDPNSLLNFMYSDAFEAIVDQASAKYHIEKSCGNLSSPI